MRKKERKKERKSVSAKPYETPRCFLVEISDDVIRTSTVGPACDGDLPVFSDYEVDGWF